MYTLGHKFMPAGIHAGGLRYHGMSAIVSQLVVIVKDTAIGSTILSFADLLSNAW